MHFLLIWLGWVVIIGLRVILPRPIPVDAQPWSQILFTIILYFFTILTAAGMGRKLTIRLTELTILEQILLALALGFGVVSTGIFFLGIIGQLSALTVYI